jgi:hypothetical protein
VPEVGGGDHLLAECVNHHDGYVDQPFKGQLCDVGAVGVVVVRRI